MDTLPSVKLDEKYKEQLIEFQSRQDVPKEWENTPIETFIMSQNFGWPVHASGKPELLIATCIEFRYSLPMPRMYAYVMRRASGRVIGSEFSVGYALSKGVKHLIMIGHNDCGMAKVPEAAPAVVQAYVDQGWSRTVAEEYVQKQGSRHAIHNELDALRDEYKRLATIFPKLVIAPLFVCLYDTKLYLPKWYPQLHAEQDAKGPAPIPDELIRNLP